MIRPFLHENWYINCHFKVFLFLFFQMESAVSSDSEGTKMMLQRLKKLRKRIPELFDMDIISEKFPVTYENSLNNVLRLEVTRYNQLLGNLLIYFFYWLFTLFKINTFHSSFGSIFIITGQSIERRNCYVSWIGKNNALKRYEQFLLKHCWLYIVLIYSMFHFISLYRKQIMILCSWKMNCLKVGLNWRFQPRPT